MDIALKAKWLEALRSGRYDQTTGQLRDGNCFCCLGVLCDVFNPGAWEVEGDWSYGEGPDQSHEIGVLPYSFKVTYGIDPVIEARLIEMNDDGATFGEIANYIEAKL